MVDMLQWSLRNKGEVINLENYVPKSFFKRAGRRGFGIAPTAVSMRPKARGGSRHRRSRRLARNIELPLTIIGEDRKDIEDRLRQLARILQDDVSRPRLVARELDGTEWSTEVAFVGGVDPIFGVDTDMRSKCDIGISLQAGDPYWTSSRPVEYIIRSGDAGRSMIPDMAELALVSSQTIGQVAIENVGDVESFPIISVRGPADSFLATLPDGRTLFYEDVIASNETITFNHTTKEVKDQNGVNKYGSLAPAPSFFSIPAGSTELNIEMLNTNSDSRVSVYFFPRVELKFG